MEVHELRLCHSNMESTKKDSLKLAFNEPALVRESIVLERLAHQPTPRYPTDLHI